MFRSGLVFRICVGSLFKASLVLLPAMQAVGQIVPLYETFEFDVTKSGVTGNLFTRFGSTTFTKGARSFAVDSFYDGADTWRTRFMPDEVGTWHYSWSLEGESGNGSFTVTAPTNPDNHGHVHRDAAHPRYLVYDDGTPHYWFGGNWMAATYYGPQSKGGQSNVGTMQDGVNTEYIDNETFTNYLNTMEEYRHNGLLLKTAQFPLENDKLSWDLSWIQRGEWLVREMRDRGIYAQINLFDTWSRDVGEWFKWNTAGGQQPFNVWAGGDEAAKENYIRTLVARFSGYANVYWELGNEMEHFPNSGSGFVTQANTNYIPWIDQYDPYDLPIALSEGIWESANVDIGLPHQTNSLPPVSTSGNRPMIMNELVFGWSGGPLWQDPVIRDAANRFGYRRTFWRMFTYGGTGSGEATWLDIATPLNSAVLTVMGDQMRLRDFVEGLPTNINEMDTDTSFVLSGPGEFRTRSKVGETYATYFMLNPNQSVGPGSVTVSLAEGNYDVNWYDPKTGTFPSQISVTANGNTVLSHPPFTEDIAMSIVRQGSLPELEPIFTWEFNTDGDQEGWRSNPGATNNGVSEGSWNLVMSGRDPSLFGPTLGESAERAHIVEIGMSSTDADTLGQIFWKAVGDSAFSEGRSRRFAVLGDGQIHRYWFDLSSEFDPTDTITQLRLDPVAGGNGGQVSIDFIRILAAVAVPEPTSAVLLTLAWVILALHRCAQTRKARGQL